MVIDKKVRKDSRSNLGQVTVKKRIIEQYGFTERSKALAEFYPLMDSTYFANAWNVKVTEGMNDVIFTIGDKDYTQADFAKYLDDTQKGSGAMDLKALVNQRYQSFKEKSLFEYKDEQLEEEFPDFKALVDEYHDGILLFNLTDELVWTKASKDTTGLEAFYEANKENYRWEKRLDAVIYTLKDAKVASQVKGLIAKGLEADSIMKIVNESSQLNLRYEQEKYEMNDNPILKEVSWKKGVQEFQKDNSYLLIDVKEVLKADYKQIDETRGIIISDYQEQLESDWIKELRGKYPYNVNQELLGQLKAELD